MVKRARTPHFITGLGDGDVHDRTGQGGTSNDVVQLRGNKNKQSQGNNIIDVNDINSKFNRDNSNNAKFFYNLRAAQKERLQRMEEPLLTSSGDGSSGDHWRDVFGNPALDNMGHKIGNPGVNFATGAWQVSAFAFLGMIVVVSAIFLHFVSDGQHDAESSNQRLSSPNIHRRRHRPPRKRPVLRKKKTDEWSDDEEPLQNGVGLVTGDVLLPGMLHHSRGSDVPSPDPYYESYQQSPYFQNQTSNSRFLTNESTLRRMGNKDHGSRHRKNSSGSNVNSSQGGPDGHGPGMKASSGISCVNPTYRSPAPTNLMNRAEAPRMPQRGMSPKNSFSSHGSHGYQQKFSSQNTEESPTGFRTTAPLSGRNRIPSTPDAKDIFRAVDPSTTSHHSAKSRPLLPPPPEESPLFMPKAPRDYAGEKFDLNARPLNSSNISSFSSIGDENESSEEERRRTFSQLSQSSSRSIKLGDGISGRSHSFSNPENVLMHSSISASSKHQQLLLVSPGNYEETPLIGNARKLVEGAGSLDEAALMPPNGTDDEFSPTRMPYIPSLKVTPGRGALLEGLHDIAPPRSVIIDELHLIQMETGNSSVHWGVNPGNDLSFAEDCDNSSDGSDISIPSNDPRKGIHHKRLNLTQATNATQSLQSDVKFKEIQLQEVIGGGGFGQVWKASWKGTPVAVKLLTGSAQNTHIAKSVLEEFHAEINLLKGMRHPNICLYIGACVDPPNRAIITELAANGSVWDALRLPLMPPYVAADGTSGGSWPIQLYVPGQHGAPPGSLGVPRISAPIPPRGSWPWELVKLVSCGAARGMAYLHGGNPPVLHRDLKSANLLLNECYTAKVCDFGLSRLKAQTRSMTGNCGTVQWMAPEVLANRKYDEKADVYSFGIIVWELLARECPYEGMTAIQCALAVLNRDKRPEIPKWCPPGLHALIKACVKKEPTERPSFEEIIRMLDEI